MSSTSNSQKIVIHPVLFLIIIVALLINVILGAQENIVFEKNRLPYGSYLMTQAIMPEQRLAPKRVILLGNSVLHYSTVADHIQSLRNQSMQKNDPNFFAIGNFGYVGSAIGDLIYTFRHIKRFKPDAVVIQTISSAFTGDLSFFKTDLKYASLYSDFISLLGNKTVRSQFTKDDYATSIVYSAFPIYRFFPVIRVGFKHWFTTTTGIKIFEYFPWTENLFDEWQLNQRFQHRNMGGDEIEYSSDGIELFRLLLSEIKKSNIKVAVITSPHQNTNERTLSEISQIARESQIPYMDFSKEYNRADYVDRMHPNQKGAKKLARHFYETIGNLLKESN